MIEKFDRFCAIPFHLLLTMLCRATGRNNFFFARCTLVATFVPVLMFTAKEPSIISYFVFGYLVLSGFLTWSKISKYEALYDASTDVVYMIPPESLLRLTTLMICIFCFTDVLPHSRMLWSYFALYITMTYFMEDIQPRSKSPLKRAVEWLAAHPIRLPSFNPAPQPG